MTSLSALPQAFTSSTSSLARPGLGQETRYTSSYNNGFGSLKFGVRSFLPGNGPFVTNTQSKEFANTAFLNVLNNLSQRGVISLPTIGLGDILNSGIFKSFNPTFSLATQNNSPILLPFRNRLGSAFAQYPAL